ncbi:MAG: hypothetical protein U0667_03605 [Chloroflexota bacterium]
MAAQLQLDSGREGLLVELAGIGADGLRALMGADAEVDLDTLATGPGGGARRDAPPMGGAAAGDEPALSAARLGAVRRRYHELGAGNLFAAEELADVRASGSTPGCRHADLEQAIRG